MFKPLQAAGACLALASAPVSAGYLFDSSGQVVRNAYGECVHNGFWQIEDAIVGCDGKVAEVVVVSGEFAAVEPVEPAIEQIVLDTETHFAFDEATLKPLATTKLDTALARLRGYDDLVAVRIAGHADRIGDSSYNRELALQRAETVARYLVGQGGLDPERLTVLSRGESQPLVACADLRGDALVDCLAPNRRVEVDIQATEIQ